MTRYYVSLNKLSVFLDNLKKTFAKISHTHYKKDVVDFPTNISEFENDVGYVTNANLSTVTIYKQPTSIPAASGMQIICYGATAGTMDFQIGNKVYSKELASGSDCGWFLWVQTSSIDGSIVTKDGRQYMNIGETIDEIGITWSPSVETVSSSSYIVITIT